MQRAETAATIDVGDVCTLATSPHARIIAHIRDRYHGFLADRDPDFEIDFAFSEAVDRAEFLDVPHQMLEKPQSRSTRRDLEPAGTGSPQPPGDSVWDARAAYGARAATAQGASPGSGSRPRVAHLGSKILVQRRDFAGCLDMSTRKGRCTFAENMHPIAVESFLRICYSFLAVESRGLLLHSAGVLRGDSGYIFPGQSGTGKSTIASLAPASHTVLSDEMVVVRKIDDEYLVHSTPFYGTSPSAERNIRAALRGVFLPVQDVDVYLKRARPAQALGRLLASVLFFGQEAALGRRLMGIAADVVERVPCYEIHFRLDDAFWECIGELERSGGA